MLQITQIKQTLSSRSNVKFFIIIAALLFSGCAGLSEYEQGCQDALNSVIVDPSDRTVNAELRLCESLNERHERHEYQSHGGNPR